MALLLNTEQQIEDTWKLLPQWAEGDVLPAGKLILPLAAWEAQGEQLLHRPETAVWIDSDEEPLQIEQYLQQIPLIAINFPVFTDGRGYSYARLLREHFDYTGELRAIGDVLVDQLFYLKRCGFDSFALRDDQNLQAALASFNAFTESYQAATDQPVPLFRRR